MTPPDFTRARYKIARCGECDAVVSVVFPLPPDKHAECPRCHHILTTTNRWSLHRCAMIALSILILMPFALGFPLLSIDLLGTKIDASVWKGIWQIATAGYTYTGFLIFICAVLMPTSFAILVLMLWFSKLLGIRPRNVLLFLSYIKPWVMFDVYLVALGVSMFKVREYATLEINIYLIAFVFTALLTTLLFIKLNCGMIFIPKNNKLTLMIKFGFVPHATTLLRNKKLNTNTDIQFARAAFHTLIHRMPLNFNVLGQP